MDAQLLRHVSQLLPGEEQVFFGHILSLSSSVGRRRFRKELVVTRKLSKDMAEFSKCK